VKYDLGPGSPETDEVSGLFAKPCLGRRWALSNVLRENQAAPAVITAKAIVRSNSGRLMSDRELQIFGCPESDLPARLNLDGLSRRRIAPHAGCALPYLQDTKTGDPDPFAFLEMLRDQTHQVAEKGFPVAFCQLMIRSQGCSKMFQRNWTVCCGSDWLF
jgi:hypothetical protein